VPLCRPAGRPEGGCGRTDLTSATRSSAIRRFASWHRMKRRTHWTQHCSVR